MYEASDLGQLSLMKATAPLASFVSLRYQARVVVVLDMGPYDDAMHYCAARCPLVTIINTCRQLALCDHWYGLLSQIRVITTMPFKDIQYPVALQVPFKQKDAAHKSGARWSSAKRTWEACNPAVLYKCRQWAAPENRLGVIWDKQWLDVPYSHRERAKSLGARFDPQYKCWYAPLGRPSLSAELNPYRMRWHCTPTL